jgi:hypothetical protein
MPLAGFEPQIPGSAQQQTHALDRAATGIGDIKKRMEKIKYNPKDSMENFKSCDNLGDPTYTVKQVTQKRRVTLQTGLKWLRKGYDGEVL